MRAGKKAAATQGSDVFRIGAVYVQPIIPELPRAGHICRHTPIERRSAQLQVNRQFVRW
jgi:hypothetical protein